MTTRRHSAGRRRAGCHCWLVQQCAAAMRTVTRHCWTSQQWHAIRRPGLSNVLLCGVAPAVVAASWLCLPTRADEPAAGEPSPEFINPLSVNANCYICHTTFVGEPISKVHFKQKVTCIKCHGVSAGHANDEDIGATKPDVVFARHQVDKMCIECHETHDVAARDVLARFVERKLTDRAAVCTDCHGHHKIERSDDQ